MANEGIDVDGKGSTSPPSQDEDENHQENSSLQESGPSEEHENNEVMSATNRLVEICSDIGDKIREICRKNHGDTREEEEDDTLWIDDSILNEIHDLVQGLKEMNESIRCLETSYIKLTTRSQQVTKDINTLKKRLNKLKEQDIKSGSEDDTTS